MEVPVFYDKWLIGSIVKIIVISKENPTNGVAVRATALGHVEAAPRDRKVIVDVAEQCNDLQLVFIGFLGNCSERTGL